MPGIKEFFGKMFNPGEKQEEGEKETEISEDEARRIRERKEAEKVMDANMNTEKIAEEQMKGDKVERPEDKKE